MAISASGFVRPISPNWSFKPTAASQLGVTLALGFMRIFSRRIDVTIALGIGAALLAAIAIIGDPIYAGIWYYLISWFALVGLVQLAKAPPFLTAGTAVALAASFLFYWAWQASLPRPEGLLGLGHLLSLPGIGIAAILAAVIARKRQLLPGAAFAVGLLSCCAGFTISQFVVCQSMLYCGSLSGWSG